VRWPYRSACRYCINEILGCNLKVIVPAIIAPQLLEQSTQSIASPAGEKGMDAIEQNSREFCRERIPFLQRKD